MHFILQKNNLPYVEYTSCIIDPDEELSRTHSTGKIPHDGITSAQFLNSVMSSVPPQSRAVAKKSTTKRQTPVDTIPYTPTPETKQSHSIVVSFY